MTVVKKDRIAGSDKKESAMKYTCKLLTALLGGLCLSLTALGSAAFAASVTAFDTDFNAGAPPEFSGVTTTESVQGYAGLGTGLDVFSGNFLSGLHLFVFRQVPREKRSIQSVAAVYDRRSNLSLRARNVKRMGKPAKG